MKTWRAEWYERTRVHGGCPELALRRSGRSTSSCDAAALLVVAEVKARKSAAFGVPALAVTPTKQQRLRRLAAAWLAEHRVGRRVDVRFDVVAITGDTVDVYENAF